jgi:GNAT superfamily N-acetyltransferase
MEYTVHEANAERWDDVARVMGANGAYAGCWCSFWRLTNQEALASGAEDNRSALQRLVCSEAPAGLLLYEDAEPIGWLSVAPRTAFPRLWHTKGITIERPEDASVWSVMCVYLTKGHRRGGLSSKLVDAAVAYASERGASIIESYPVLDSSHGKPSGLASGTIGMFARAGFTMQSQPPSGRRVVMRRAV